MLVRGISAPVLPCVHHKIYQMHHGVRGSAIRGRIRSEGEIHVMGKDDNNTHRKRREERQRATRQRAKKRGDQHTHRMCRGMGAGARHSEEQAMISRTLRSVGPM